ncbi:hypothetical protein ACIPC1_13510 [Streptomyces sp. NPDC087263]|uniref:hypothetical protein n=1 Tax=Streptomyces sp. NPDC087263 TaxID=3365773 RepID=UPI0037F713D2
MSATTSPKSLALLLITLGLLASITATVAAIVTHEQAWRYAISLGCLLQLVGWVLHGRQLRGGA